MNWLRERVKHLAERPWALVLLVPVVTGVIVLMGILPGAFAAIPPVVAAIAVAIRIADAHDVAKRFPLPATALHYAALLVRWAGAFAVPLMALLGLDWYAAKLGWRPSPAFGMFVAAVLLGLADWVYLHAWWTRPGSKHPREWAIATTVALVLVAAGAGAWQAIKREDPPADDAAVSELEVVVVGSGAGFPRVDPPTEDTGWKVHAYAGRAAGEKVVWDEHGPPPARPAHDRVLLLDVDGTDGQAGDDDPSRWAALAADAGRDDATTFALLRTGDDARVNRWRERFRPASETRPGDVVRLTGPLATSTPSDLALRLVARAPTADEDLSLAIRHRPVLLFHQRGEPERTPVPLNIDRLIAADQFRLCSTKQVVVGNCTNVDESSDIRNGSNYLEFNTQKLAQHTEGTTIYVHVTDHDGLKYLDYWWYLPDNPSNAGGGALCGAGFVVAGYTCHDHQSDWEGVTVVVDPKSDQPSPDAVVYSGHTNRTRYTWPALERLWSTGYTATVARNHASTERPLVFIARGTHAAYPTGCRAACTDPFTFHKEEPHDGRLPWPGPREPECVALCITALPTTDRGRKPARWNAYNGRWGNTRCELIVFCSSADPPRSPGQQGRYKKPWCPTISVVVANGRLERERRPPACR